MFNRINMFLDGGGTTGIGLPKDSPSFKEDAPKPEDVDEKVKDKPEDESSTTIIDKEDEKSEKEKPEEKPDEKTVSAETYEVLTQTQKAHQEQTEWMKENFPDAQAAYQKHRRGEEVTPPPDKPAETSAVSADVLEEQLIAQASAGLDMDDPADALKAQLRLNNLQAVVRDKKRQVEKSQAAEDQSEAESKRLDGLVVDKVRNIASRPRMDAAGKPVTDKEGKVIPLYPPEVIKQAYETADSYSTGTHAQWFQAFTNSLNHEMLLNNMSETKAGMVKKAEEQTRRVLNTTQPSAATGIETKEKTDLQKDIDELNLAANKGSSFQKLQDQTK